MKPVSENILIEAAKTLKPLLEEIAFVGGGILPTYLPKGFDSVIRVTYDLDVVIKLAHYGKLEKLNKRLKDLGFYPDRESTVICRYTDKHILLDVMPTDSEILGFSNRWYEEGLNNKEWISLTGEIDIPRFTIDYYLATKWEAVRGRGKQDWRTSKDMEDIVTLINHNALNQISSKQSDVNVYLKNQFSDLLNQKYAGEIILSHLSGVDRQNIDLLKERVQTFIQA
ncbi:hypothetical protein [Rhodohalobacter sp.]|uniref:hypothetical protein n=1 Tax=Rhodohalobacter sp. TaxID=1974210 RepID=UPI002ACE81F5|nr:hypothetical protein [Rhodohalobacter sp.]MDZ7755877.1 hypothetical protein [Rhodohalobacter sp.]